MVVGVKQKTGDRRQKQGVRSKESEDRRKEQKVAVSNLNKCFFSWILTPVFLGVHRKGVGRIALNQRKRI